MPFPETGTQELLERVLRGGPPRAHPRGARTPPAPTTSCSRSARPRYVAHRDRHVADPRSVVDDLLPVLREGHSLILRSTVAPGHHRVGGRATSSSGAASASARTCSSRTCPSGSPRTTSSRRSRRCRASSAASASDSGARAAELFEVFGTEIVQTTPGAGRARQDLDQHPALHAVRAAQPADDGVRAVRRERVRGDRPDQPRLPARRDRAARA